MKIGILAVALSVSAFGNAVFNGDFQTGDLSGWTTFTTAGGVIGTPTVVSFDTTGSGPSLAAQLDVGQVTFVPGDQEGGGLQQTVTLAAGSYSFFANIAASATVNNSEFGVFSVLIDGTVESTTDLGSLSAAGTILGTLSASFSVATSGAHQLEILVTRPFATSPTTPFQYLDNVAINGSAVPEPASFMLGTLGMAGLALARLRKG